MFKINYFNVSQITTFIAILYIVCLWFLSITKHFNLPIELYGLPEYVSFISLILTFSAIYYKWQNFKKSWIVYLFLSACILILLSINSPIINSASIFLNLFGNILLALILFEIFINLKHRSILFIFTFAIITFILSNLENYFDLKPLIRPEWFLEKTINPYNRWGFSQVTFTFPSPMTAGQWFWFLGSLSLYISRNKNYWDENFLLLSSAMFFSVVILTLARGPIFLSIFSIIIFLFSYKKFKFLYFFLGFLICSIIFNDLYEPIYLVIKKFFDPTEAANSTRIIHISNGLKELFSNFKLLGNGLSTISPLIRHQYIQFENTYLTLIFAGGLGSVIYILFLSINYFYTLKVNAQYNNWFMLITLPWFIYSFVFPFFIGVDTSLITSITVSPGLLYFLKKVDINVFNNNQFNKFI